MVKIEILMKEGKLSRITDIEMERYLNFFESSWKDNLSHSKYNMERFPRWSIISGYYAMHDITKLLLARKFRLRIDMEVHATTIKVLREVIRNKQITEMIERGYREFLNMASDLHEAKKERVKAQYYTGTKFMHEEYVKRAKDFRRDVVTSYIEKMKELLK